MIRKPTILYYSNGLTDKARKFEKAVQKIGCNYIPVSGQHLLQTIGYLARVKGFPQRKVSVLEQPAQIPMDIMVMSNCSDEHVDKILKLMKEGEIPPVPLKAVVTPNNCFWTFSHLAEELMEERRQFLEP